MTKTQYLQLNTWVDSDPVDLAQMNENFSILDQKGGHTITCSEAANINLSCALLQSKCDGKDVSFAQRAALFDLTHWDDISQYENVLVASTGSKIPEAAFTGIGQTSIVKNVHQAYSPVKFFSFQPTSYAMLTSIAANFTGYHTGTCSIEARCGEETVATSNTLSLASAQSATFSFSAALDPNKTYDLYFSTTMNSTTTLRDITIHAQPIAPSAGKITTVSYNIPSDTKRIILHLHAAGPAPTLQLQFGGGAFTSALTAAASGSASFHRYETVIPAGTQTMAARINLSSADTVVYGCCGAML